MSRQATRPKIARERRLTLRVFLLQLAFLIPVATTAGERPNVILVLIDDMGWGDFSCFGNRDIRTENIDRLAAEGIRFEQFYVNSPICSPSRTAITTGQYPQRWRITSYLDNRAANERRGVAQWLDPRAPVLARFLQANGYATGHFGKWHMGGQRDVGDAPLITAYGFDESLTQFEGLGPRLLGIGHTHDGRPPFPVAHKSDKLGHGPVIWMDRARLTEGFVGSAIQFLDRAASAGKPFYINVWPDDVHSPFFPPKERRGDGSQRSLYLGVLKTMDEQLGVLFDHVRNNERLRDNTLIMVCSDNGPEKGSGSAGPFRGHKTMLYEGGIRSPLIAWGPGVIEKSKAGSANTKSFLAAIDLVPSLLALTGTAAPPDVAFDGVALPDVLVGNSLASRGKPLFFRRPPDRDAFYGEADLPDLAVREGKWKLLCEYDGSCVQLYDLDTDRGETANLASQQRDITSRLVSMVLDWHKSMPADNGAMLSATAAGKKPQPNSKP
jgi:uncharacterized sulfatase